MTAEQEGAQPAAEAPSVGENTPSWDWLVRIAHWSVAVLFAANYFFTKEGRSTLEDIEIGETALFPWNGYDIHANIGWAILILVGVRIAWGLFAPGPARISRFFPTPRRIAAHWKELVERAQPEQVGHNPFGALAIFAMWYGLATATLSGWGMDTDWAYDNDYSDFLYEYHYFIIDATFYVVCLHITAVVLMSFWGRRNLVKAMVRGRF